ncbi:MAG: RidA family protein [Gracilibacteraceae bacterium]|jgi:2-iminobutanoate/2-iminopropanoate deaminase|nr:RidA family protein [Gracilibacteraceae bacterium]
MPQAVKTSQAPTAIGPYSQGIITGNFVYTSGQIPLDPKNGQMAADIKQATKRSLENIKAVLDEAGSGLDRIVKTTVYLKDMADFQAMNEVYATYFQEPFPARSCVQVAKLPLDALVEIEAIAVTMDNGQWTMDNGDKRQWAG